MINVKINSSRVRVEKYDIKIDQTYSDFMVQSFSLSSHDFLYVYRKIKDVS